MDAVYQSGTFETPLLRQIMCVASKPSVIALFNNNSGMTHFIAAFLTLSRPYKTFLVNVAEDAWQLCFAFSCTERETENA